MKSEFRFCDPKIEAAMRSIFAMPKSIEFAMRIGDDMKKVTGSFAKDNERIMSCKFNDSKLIGACFTFNDSIKNVASAAISRLKVNPAYNESQNQIGLLARSVNDFQSQIKNLTRCVKSLEDQISALNRNLRG